MQLRSTLPPIRILKPGDDYGQPVRDFSGVHLESAQSHSSQEEEQKKYGEGPRLDMRDVQINFELGICPSTLGRFQLIHVKNLQIMTINPPPVCDFVLANKQTSACDNPTQSQYLGCAPLRLLAIRSLLQCKLTFFCAASPDKASCCPRRLVILYRNN